MYTDDESEILHAMYDSVTEWRVVPPENGSEKYVISTSGGDLYMIYHDDEAGPFVVVELRVEGQPNETV
jgi:hypothetical protein